MTKFPTLLNYSKQNLTLLKKDANHSHGQAYYKQENAEKQLKIQSLTTWDLKNRTEFGGRIKMITQTKQNKTKKEKEILLTWNVTEDRDSCLT